MKTKKHNILFILPFFPWPLKSGGHQAIFNGLYVLKDYANIYITYEKGINEKHDFLALEKIFGRKITILPYIRTNNNNRITNFTKRVLNKILRLITTPTLEEKARNFMQTDLHETNYYYFVNNIINTYSIDIVQIEMIENIDFVLSIPQNVKKIFVHHELRYIRNKLYLMQKESSIFENVLLDIERIKEISLLNRFDKIITLSDIDKRKLIEMGIKIPIHTSFAVVHTNESINITNSTIKHNRVLSFVGPEKHTPNKLGLKWFLDNCWEKLREYDSSYQLQIIGIWSEVTQQQWKSKYDNIIFLGFVDNLSSIISTTIMIVPITVGSGIRMKILEAMSNKVPFISTSVGAEGISVRNGIDCFIADHPSTFIKSIISLEDIDLRNQFVESAFQFVKENYSIDKLKDNRINIYESI